MPVEQRDGVVAPRLEGELGDLLPGPLGEEPHHGIGRVGLQLLGGEATDGTDPLSEAINRLTAEHGTLFVVAAGNTGQAASEPDGTYTLNTYGTHDGALVGKHTVTVERYLMPMPTQPGGKMASAKATVSKKYTRPETSPLKVEVKSGTNNVIDLPLENK